MRALIAGLGLLALIMMGNCQPSLPVFSLVEFSAPVTANYSNPFDYSLVSPKAHFFFDDGSKATTDGFYYQNYSRALVGGYEQVTPVGQPVWVWRYTPTQVGNYSYALYIDDDKVAHGEFQATAISSDSYGYVRVNALSHMFELDSGTPYFAIGENMCWGNGPGTFSYDTWLPKLAHVGGNYIRLWTDADFATFYVEDQVGEYNLGNLWKLDYVMNLAQSLDVRVMLELNSYNQYRFTDYYPTWETAPYNKANGGPLNEPAELFTNRVALALMENRLRYLAARYGYSTHLLSWEMFNEVDGIQNYVSQDVAHWHAQMADVLMKYDNNQHMVTTSFSNSMGDPNVDSLPQMSYTQTHIYNEGDFVQSIGQYTLTKVRAYGKPNVPGEFGLGAPPMEQNDDPTGVYLHNGVWGPFFSGAAGTAMTWWWDGYVDPCDVYWRFQGMAVFMNDSLIAAASDVLTGSAWEFYSPMLDDASDQDYSFVRVNVRASPEFAFVFAQNSNHTWWLNFKGMKMEMIEGAVVNITFAGPFQSGTVTVAAYNTTTGAQIGERATATNDPMWGVGVALPAFNEDVAVIAWLEPSTTEATVRQQRGSKVKTPFAPF